MHERTILVAGFGPFLEVTDNPAARLAAGVDGSVLRGDDGPIRVVGRTMPVSYAEAPLRCARWREELDAVAVLGVGVARGRAEAQVERRGLRRVDPIHADVDGVCLADLDPDGPDAVAASGPVEALAAALGISLSDDAGAYVCNAWLYRTVRLLPGVPVAFLHVPPDGMAPERLIRALPAMLRPPG